MLPAYKAAALLSLAIWANASVGTTSEREVDPTPPVRSEGEGLVPNGFEKEGALPPLLPSGLITVFPVIGLRAAMMASMAAFVFGLFIIAMASGMPIMAAEAATSPIVKASAPSVAPGRMGFTSGGITGGIGTSGILGTLGVPGSPPLRIISQLVTKTLTPLVLSSTVLASPFCLVPLLSPPSPGTLLSNPVSPTPFEIVPINPARSPNLATISVIPTSHAPHALDVIAVRR